MDDPITILPFLKWAGGKRWLVNAHSQLLDASFERYLEPFLGSGAVFFHLGPQHAVLSDKNEDLVVTYQAIKDCWEKVLWALQKHHLNHSEHYYYQVRSSRPRAMHMRAARFIYLNRTCWNGLYRVNQQGGFNVPIGTKNNVMLETDDFSAVSKRLAGAELRNDDFEKVIDLAGAGDFVFVDPPYTVKHNLNGFVKYNEKLFSWDDQERLSAAIKRAVERGARVLVTNADHESVRSLYAGFGRHYVLERSNVIAGNPKFRGRYQELVIQCW
jgi:DNA adenine methylase